MVNIEITRIGGADAVELGNPFTIHNFASRHLTRDPFLDQNFFTRVTTIRVKVGPVAKKRPTVTGCGFARNRREFKIRTGSVLVAADPAGTNPNVDAAITTATSEVQTRDLRRNTPDWT